MNKVLAKYRVYYDPLSGKADSVSRVEYLIGRLGVRSVSQISEATCCVVLRADSACVVRAQKLDIPIVSVQWLEMCYKLKQALPFEQFPVTLFCGLTVCHTQMERDQRERIKSLVEGNGGRTDGQLDRTSTTHLVAVSGEGSKYDHAVLWGIPVVSLQWITDSVAQNRLLDTATYAVRPRGKSGQGSGSREADASKDPHGTLPPADTPVPELSVHELVEMRYRLNSFLAANNAALRLEDAILTQWLDRQIVFVFGPMSQALSDWLNFLISQQGGVRSYHFGDSVTTVLALTAIDGRILHELRQSPYELCLTDLLDFALRSWTIEDVSSVLLLMSGCNRDMVQRVLEPELG